MTGKEIYERAITSLGYKDSQVFKDKAVVAINQVYAVLFPSVGIGEYKEISSLSERVFIPDRVAAGAMVYGVAEKLALGEADGELQQYFALRFDRAMAKINIIDSVVDIFPK